MPACALVPGTPLGEDDAEGVRRQPAFERRELLAHLRNSLALLLAQVRVVVRTSRASPPARAGAPGRKEHAQRLLPTSGDVGAVGGAARVLRLVPLVCEAGGGTAVGGAAGGGAEGEGRALLRCSFLETWRS